MNAGVVDGQSCLSVGLQVRRLETIQSIVNLDVCEELQIIFVSNL